MKKNQENISQLFIAGSLLLGLVVISGFLYFQRPRSPGFTAQPFISTFNECAQLTGSTILESYPRQCKSEDGKTYIEEVTQVFDTSDWTIFSEIKGFSFQCPPGWTCEKNSDESAFIWQNHSLNIETFQLSLITPENFQKSLIRHPAYNNPIAWLKALRAKDAKALTVSDSTLKAVPGTDTVDAPLYSGYSFDTLDLLSGDVSDATKISGTETNIFVPVNSTDLVLIQLFPHSLVKDPVVTAIIRSIQ